MIEELINTNCIRIGKFTLKNGETSKYYYNIKNIISNPCLLKKIGDKIYKMLNDFDIICGVHFGGLPIASYISTTYNKPMIFVSNRYNVEHGKPPIGYFDIPFLYDVFNSMTLCFVKL